MNLVNASVAVLRRLCVHGARLILAMVLTGIYANSVLAQARSNEPNWLQPYARSQLIRQHLDPLQRTSLPLSMPARVGEAARYSVDLEGKVTLLQYRHQADDSPLLIQRHYDAVLAQAGFERVMVCAEPCPTSGGAARWMNLLDRSRQIDYSFFPDAPTVLVAHKANAIAFVAIGKNSNFPFGTTIKLIEGTYTNPDQLKTWLDSLKPAAVTTPAIPAIVAPQGTTASNESKPEPYNSAEIELIPPGRLNAAISQTKGLFVVMLSSRDANCPHCARANPRYASVAKSLPDAARYGVVFWEPWADAFKQPSPLHNSTIRGIPTYLVYQDGKLINRVNGNVIEPDLKTQLFEWKSPSGEQPGSAK
jgi:hypothetical protein